MERVNNAAVASTGSLTHLTQEADENIATAVNDIESSSTYYPTRIDATLEQLDAIDNDIRSLADELTNQNNYLGRVGGY
jgi:archaellum component FlaC